MSVDEAILDASGRGEVPPTLRLYAWSPPCISLGYAQPLEDVHLSNLEQNNWEIVRRPTGGKAILHTDELTYSICGPISNSLLRGSVLESYQRLSLGLLDALRRLEITADAAEMTISQNDQEQDNPVCFEVPSNYEITVEGKKIIGSAQARRKSGVLQHGTLPLFGDLTRILQVLNYQDEHPQQLAAARLLEHATTVESVLGYKGDWWLACQAFKQGFQNSLSINLVQDKLSPSEGKRAMELFHNKYSHPEWTERFGRKKTARNPSTSSS